MIFALNPVYADPTSEVIQETDTKVIVREHPRTGDPYVSIVSSRIPDPPSPFRASQRMKRPDYRLLDPKVKAKDVPYEGPVSDRKKIYALAAALSAVGIAGGAIGMASASAAAATGAAASGGAGAYAVAGGAVAAGTVAGAVAATKTGSGQENFKQDSEARLLERR